MVGFIPHGGKGCCDVLWVGLEGFDLICSEGIDPCQGSFEAMNGQSLLRDVQIVHVHEAYCGRPQAVPIGEEKEGPVPRPRDDPEEGAQLRLGQKLDGGRASGVRPHASRDARGKMRTSASVGDNRGTR